MLNFAYKKFSNHLTTNIDEQTKVTTPTITAIRKGPGGRHKGATNLKNHQLKEVMLVTKNKIVSIYMKGKENCRMEGYKLPNNRW